MGPRQQIWSSKEAAAEQHSPESPQNPAASQHIYKPLPARHSQSRSIACRVLCICGQRYLLAVLSSSYSRKDLNRDHHKGTPDRQAAARSRCARPRRMPRRARAGARAASAPYCRLPAQTCFPGILRLGWAGWPCADLWRSWPHTPHASPPSALSGLLQAAREPQNAHCRPLPASTARRTARGLHQISRVMWSPGRV